jgi:hypothetical protein
MWKSMRKKNYHNVCKKNRENRKSSRASKMFKICGRVVKGPSSKLTTLGSEKIPLLATLLELLRTAAMKARLLFSMNFP